MYDINDFIRSAEVELREYESHAQRFEALQASNQEKQAGLNGRLVEAQAQLADLALIDTSEESVRVLAERLGQPALLWAFEEVNKRADRVRQRLIELENDPLFAERELHRLRVETELREVEPPFQLAQSELETLDRLEGFSGLLERQWGTSGYPHRGMLRFFNREFLRDWKNADAVVAARGAKDFGAVVRSYQEKSEQVKVLGDRVRRLHRQLEQIAAREFEHQKLTEEQANLPRLMRARLGSELASYLSVRGPESAQNFPDPEDVQRALAVVEGVQHQVRYLEETANKLEADLGGLMERAGRLREEVRRYEGNRHRYRNKSFNQDQWDKRFGRAGRYQRLGDRYERTTEVIYVYDRYDTVSPWEQFLWWDVITDGRIDGNFIPEVAEYHNAYPDYSYDRTVYSSAPDSGSWDRDDS